MVAEDDGPPLESRTPTLEDLIELCRRLNEEGAEYVVIGGTKRRISRSALAGKMGGTFSNPRSSFSRSWQVSHPILERLRPDLIVPSSPPSCPVKRRVRCPSRL